MSCGATPRSSDASMPRRLVSFMAFLQPLTSRTAACLRVMICASHDVCEARRIA
jgi:hypothetical protein